MTMPKAIAARVRTGLSTAAMMGVLSFSAAAHAQPCFEHRECPGEQSCVDLACMPDQLASCTDADDCEWTEDCFDGFCKVDGVSCQNAAGSCDITRSFGECICWTGDGHGWGSEVEEDLTGEELWRMCIDDLEDACGVDGPVLPESCTEAVLPRCEVYARHLSSLLDRCGLGDGPVFEFGLTADCCNRFHEPTMPAYLDCILAIPIDECRRDEITACSQSWPDGDDDDDGAGDDGAGDDGNVDPGSDDGKTDDDEVLASRGCSVVAPSVNASGLLVGFALIGCRRRRRRLARAISSEVTPWS